MCCVMTAPMHCMGLYALLPVAAAWLVHLPPAVRRPAAAVRGAMVSSNRHRLKYKRRAVPPALQFGIEFPEDDEVDDEEEEEEVSRSWRLEHENEIQVSETPAENMTVAELKSQLKLVGQKSTGTKKELIARVHMIQRRHEMGLPVSDMQVPNEEKLRWYMLQTANGFERAVERTINMAVTAQRLTDKIERVFVPITEGETSVRESSVMPSYIFIRMRMDSKLHFLISNMQYVTSFVGSDRGGRSGSGQMDGNRGFVLPMPMTDEAFEKIVALTRKKPHMADDDGTDEVVASPIAIDDIVAVREGPFKGMQGPVLERNPLADAAEEADEADEHALTVVLPVMGRDTPVTVPERYCAKVGEAV